MAKKNQQVDMAPLERDDALFAALGKNKKRKRRKIIITVVSIVLVLAIVAVVGVTTLQKRVREEFAASAGEVLSYEVTTGSISTVPVPTAHKVAKPKKKMATSVVTAIQVSSGTMSPTASFTTCSTAK